MLPQFMKEGKSRRLGITLVGGGTGPVDISAIVSVADDGGSTGLIRDQIDMPAPGDIRNVLTALSDVETKLENLFAYRFKKEALGGHALGNLMLAAMTEQDIEREGYGDSIHEHQSEARSTHGGQFDHRGGELYSGSEAEDRGSLSYT